MKTIATSIVMLFAVSAFANQPAAPAAAPAAPAAATAPAKKDCKGLKGDAHKKCEAELKAAAPAATTTH